MSDSPNLGLPFIEAAQAQKHVTHNEALAMLDAFVQTTVLAMSATAPPAPPVEGARVVVGAGAAGAFAGREGRLAMYDAGAWRFFAPRAGWLVWSTADRCAFVHDGAAWVRFDASISRLQQLSLLGVGTTADATNPLAVSAGNALFTARSSGEGGDGSLRFKLNKEAAGRTVSQLYQTNWSGRAETGLVGDDRWRVRVSGDGQAWSDPLIASTSGVEIGGQLTVASGVRASAAPWVDLSCVWNNVAVTFVAARLALTDTASAAASRFVEYWRNGAAVYAVSKAGALLSASGANAAPGQSFIADPDTGFTNPAADTIGFVAGGVEQARLTAGGTFAVGSVGADFGRVWKAVFSGNVATVVQAGVVNGNTGATASALISLISGAPNVFVNMEVNNGAGNGFGQETFGAGVTSHRVVFGGSERFRFAASGDLQMGGANTVLTAARHLVLRAYPRTAAPAGSIVGETIFITNPASGSPRPFHWTGAAWLDGAGVAF